MKKKLLTMILAMAMVVAMCSGCGYVNSTNTIKKNSIDQSVEIYLDKEAVDKESDRVDVSNFELVQLDGKDCYHIKKNKSLSFSDAKKKYYIIATDRSFYVDDSFSLAKNINDIVGHKNDIDLLDVFYKEYLKECNYTITFNYDVEKTNGTILDDGRTVEFDLVNGDKEVYAYCKGSKNTLSKDRTGEESFTNISKSNCTNDYKAVGKKRRDGKIFVTRISWTLKPKFRKFKSITIKKNGKKVKNIKKYWNGKKFVFNKKGKYFVKIDGDGWEITDKPIIGKWVKNYL